MQNNDAEDRIDLVKLFIVLMTLSAVGFGIGAVYLYRQDSAYADFLDKEDKALFDLKTLIQRPENKQNYGFTGDKASRTTSSELSRYLSNTAKIAGVSSNLDRIPLQIHPAHKDYIKATVKLKFTAITLEQLVRYLHHVQEGKKDVFIEAIRLYKLDYNEQIPTCSADVDILIYEEPEKS